MEKLFTLLGLQRQAQEAATLDTLGHIVANDTHKLVPYRQAIFWLAEGRRVSLHSASGNALLDEKGPYAVALKNVIHNQAFTQGPSKGSVQSFTPELLKQADTSLPSAHALLVPFITQKDGVTGGLWLERDIPFEKAEQQLLGELSFGYAYALAMLKLRRHDWLSNLRGRHAGRLTAIVAAGLVMCLFIPVRLSVTAPAEIVAQNPRIIAAPFEGLMEQILVQPGDTVEPNQPVARMDTIALQARLDMTAQGQEISRAALARLRRESLTSPEKKTELKKLEAEIVAQQIEYDYARAMMERATIRSPHAGTAIFADKNALQGKSVRTGDKIMTIADPAAQELLIRIPAEAMIALDKNATVRFFLNVSPLDGYDARIRGIGYQATPDADGLISYKIHASLDETAADMRVGWKGTAKLYGRHTLLGYALLRRPLMTLRTLTGL